MTESAHMQAPDISKSDALYTRSQGLIPAHTQTLAKGPTQYVDGVAPKYLVSGSGSHVRDVDGNEYIDFNMAIGPVSLGYCYPAVDDAIRRQLQQGITFSLMHPLEVELAELIREVAPNAESVRYSKTGADVTSAAVRLARAYTGRDKVLCCGYHGWHDWYVSTTPRNFGVPRMHHDLIETFVYNDIDSVAAKLDRNVACVILEPMIFEFPQDKFLHKLRNLCIENGTLLIFDEMWTGFRLALGGAQAYFDVSADLVCYSKAIANGMPLAVLAGRVEVMQLLDEQVFFFTTFGGEALSLSAAHATITELRARSVPEYLYDQGQKLQDGYNEIAASHGLGTVTACKGHPSRAIVFFNQDVCDALIAKSFVQQELVKRGILWGGFHNMCFSHSDEDIVLTLHAYDDVLRRFKRALDAENIGTLLEGKAVQPAFRKTS